MTGADALLPALSLVFRALARSSVEGGLFVVAIWAVSRAVPRIPAAARAALWWIACARFAISLAGVAPLGVPLTLPAPFAVAVSESLSVSARLDTPAGLAAVDPATSTLPGVEPASPARLPGGERSERPVGGALLAFDSLVPAWPWTAWLALAWLALAALALARIALGLWRSVLVARGATRVDPSVLPVMRRVTERFELARDPDVRVSEAVRSPQVVWAGHAVVVLPTAALDSWTTQDVALALAHEVAHLQRHDLAWGFIPAVVARAFAFHPMARLAAREYALAREAACDAEVLARTGTSPFDYGKLLLALGVTRRPALSLSSAAWSGRSLKRRLVMLEHHSSSRRFHARWIVIPAALFAGLVGLTVAAPGPGAHEPTSLTGRAATDRAPALAVIGSPDLAVADDQQAPPPPAPPRPPAPPHAPAPPPPPPPPPHVHAGLHMESMDEVADAWVYLSGDQTLQHGSRHDRRIAEGLRKGGEPIFWFARDGKEYVIRDKATLDRVEQLLGPEGMIADDQRDLAQSQAKLAHEQAKIAAEQAEVASRMAELGAKQAALSAEEAQLRAQVMASRTDQGIDEAKAREIETRAREYEWRMQALETEMRAHDERMRAYEPGQAELARQMEQRAREVEAHMEQASLELKELLTKAIASGVAAVVR